MDDRGWNQYATDFADEVLNVIQYDTEGLIETAIRDCLPCSDDDQHTAPVAGDFGCGIGWGLPLLAPLVDHVYALDIAESFLQIARKTEFDNVTFTQWDLASKQKPPVPKLDLILSLQVLITADEKIRAGILRSYARSLKKGGFIILSVPALESQLWVYRNLHRRFPKSRSTNHEVHENIRREIVRIDEGIIRLDRFDTKFYMGHEIEADLGACGFEVVQGGQLHYDWSEELLPANWSTLPAPWNWFVVAQFTGENTD